MVKITDVANKAGVAKSTVSNVLTGNKYVSEDLKRKVLSACEELDFSPNFYASGLSSRKTKIVALLLENRPDFDQYGFYKDLIIACLAEAASKSYGLLIYYNSDKDKLLDTLRQGRAPIDGAIIMSPCVNDQRLEQMESNRTCCVVIGRPDSDRLSYVDVDNKKLVQVVSQKLISDYGKDVYLINSRAEMTISQDRQAAFLQVCQSFGFDGKDRVIESKNSDEQDGYKLALERVKADSVFLTANEKVAGGVYRAVKEKGLRVGKDVAVFSLGRSQAHGVFSPRLSYAVQDYVQLGKMAVDALVAEIECDEQKRHVKVDSSMVFTESTSKSDTI